MGDKKERPYEHRGGRAYGDESRKPQSKLLLHDVTITATYEHLESVTFYFLCSRYQLSIHLYPQNRINMVAKILKPQKLTKTKP